jgi:GTPase-associated protein 1, N-terminal domain type 2
MNEKTLHCHQAIHTSIRSPMGEGYRIVASSPGLKAQEKQAITRNSPSLDSICLPPDGSDTEPLGVSYYSLPTGRLCVSLSCFAGEEHTGRGGRRVYTMNLVFDAEDFALCGYSAFRIVRAAMDAGLIEPELHPKQSLPIVELRIRDDDDALQGARLPSTLAEPFRPFILSQAMRGESVVVDLKDDWTEWAEAMLLGVPGPMRAGVSFSAGLNFSTSRKHALQFLCDCKGKAKTRSSSIGAAFLSTSTEPPSVANGSEWTTMAERHWREGRLAELSRRTSRAYDDTSAEACEHLAMVFAAIDDLGEFDPARLAIRAAEVLKREVTGEAKAVCEEFADKAGETIVKRLTSMSSEEMVVLFSHLVSIWRRGRAATTFAEPVIDALLRKTVVANSLMAARLALQIASNAPNEADLVRRDSLIEMVLTEFAAWATQTHDPALGEVPDLVARWESVRPGSPELAGITDRCATVLAETSAKA